MHSDSTFRTVAGALGVVTSVVILLMFGLSCGDGPKTDLDELGVVTRVGSVTIYEKDVDHLLADKFDGRTDDRTRAAALDQLVHQAHYVQAALEAGLDGDAVVRAEVARLLESRLREQELNPKLKAASDIPESRLRELYEAAGSRFVSSEQRQVAVLWLKPSSDPERRKQYMEKLTSARDWLLEQPELVANPTEGFGVLSIDHSEHPSSRYKGGVVGWMERAGGLDDWSKAVAEIAFDLGEAGMMSEVVEHPEGFFLVRLLARKDVVQRPFEAVASQLKREEQSRLGQEIEDAFDERVLGGDTEE